jgi:hypothetical protein
MNNEPVAWIAYDEFGDFMLEAKPEGDYPWQPLYTHPAKTLTDEEIEEVWHQAINDWKKVDDGTARLKNQPFVFLARAILKKASEK